ncbi:MAG TPA: TOMM system kinase/cyclase fusion protein, partial [Polyangiaceae bacterium]
IVHRDLKPDNVMVVSSSAQQYAKVLDFGIGAFLDGAPDVAAPALTRSQEIVGTPCYSAPEQLRGEAATEKSDLYAWGLVFLECLTGQRVMNGATLAEVFQRQLSPLAVPLPAAIATHPLGEVLRRALVKASRERTGDARRLLSDLRRVPLGDLVGRIEGVASSRPQPTLMIDGTSFSGEQRQATALSCSLSVLALSDDRPDAETLDATVREQLNLCADIVTRFGGYVTGTLANRLIAVFGVPHASDNDARHAGLSALEIASKIEARRPVLAAQRGFDLELHIGMHTDVVIINPDGSASGPALDVAARLESLAEAGTTLVSGATRQLLFRHLNLMPAQAAAFPGTRAAIELYALVSSNSAALPSAPAGGGPSVALVGRRDEMALLRSHFDGARAGDGRAVLLRGDPGVGKSRVVREVTAHARSMGAATIECQCLPEDVNTALHPVTSSLRRHFQVDGEGGARLSLLSDALSGCALDAAELMPIICAWLGLDELSNYPPTRLSGERQRELLLDALAKLLCWIGRDAGTVIVLEDLQWADATTRELIGRLVGVAPQHAVLVLLTARTEFGPEPSGTRLLELQGLEPSAAESLVKAHAGAVTLDPSTVSRIVARADGIPLFVEELTRDFVETGARTPGSAQASRDLIPLSLQDLLNGRLDRLGQAKEIAQLAAAIGREFDAELVGAISLQGLPELRTHLDTLVDAQLLRREVDAKGTRYEFRHALIREAAWDSMLASRRRAVHRAIATHLEAIAPDGQRSDPARLAHHYTLGSEAEKAIDYRLLAGQRAAQASAYQEATEHFQAGLSLLEAVADQRDRTSREIDLRNALGGVLIATQGFATDAVVDCFTRSGDLLRRGTTSPSRRLMTLKGLWTFHNASARYPVASEMAEQLLELAAAEGGPEFHLVAHECACQTAVLMGKFNAAVQHEASCSRVFDPGSQREHGARYGLDPRLSSLSFACTANAALGRIESARQQLDLLLGEAHGLGFPALEAPILAQGAWVELLLGAAGPRLQVPPEACLEKAGKAVALASEFGLRFAEGYGRLVMAMAGCPSGDEASLNGLKLAIKMWRLSGLRAALSWHHAFLAQGQVASGDYAGALLSAEEALEHCKRTGEGYGLSEAHRILGLVLGDEKSPNHDRARAVAAYAEALKSARRQEARWLELRAAYTQANQLRDDVDAGENLTRVLDWFEQQGEGADTPLVKASRALLA